MIKFILESLVFLMFLGNLFFSKTFDDLCDIPLFFWFVTGVLIFLEAVLLWEYLPPILYWVMSIR